MKRWKPSMMELFGLVIGAAGVAGLVWGSWEQFTPDRIGIVLLIVGAMLLCTKCLKDKNMAADEVYRIAYDRGVEDGYEQGREDCLADGCRPTIATVVDLHPKCEDCGKPAARSLVR